MKAMREPSGDQRMLEAPSGAPGTATGSPPDTAMRKRRLMVLFEAISAVATEKMMLFESGEGATSPMVLTAIVSAAENGAFVAASARICVPSPTTKRMRFMSSDCTSRKNFRLVRIFRGFALAVHFVDPFADQRDAFAMNQRAAELGHH